MPRRVKESTGTQIVATLESTFRKYLALDGGFPLVLTLWTLATHFFDCFDSFPYLGITSPTKQCGKTRLAEIIELFCANGLRTVSATPAAVFRTIQMYSLEKKPLTLIIDEAEVLGARSERSEALREILNAGYRKGQCVLRCEGADGKYEPKQFNTYCPKVIVLIGNLDETLADRCIAIKMRRRKKGENVDRFFPSRAHRGARGMQKQIAKVVVAYQRSVKRHYSGKDIEFLEDREAELWLPIFSVCIALAPDRLEHLKAIAGALSNSKRADEPAEFGVLLLRDMRDIFDSRSEDRVTTYNLLQLLSVIDESPWSEWNRGRGLDARGLARLLKPFRISPHNIRVDENTVAKGYDRVDFEDAWATYLPAESAPTPPQAP